MEIIIGILGIIVGLVLAVIPYFRSKYFLRPELTIEIGSDGGSSSPRGLSNNNDFTNGPIDAEAAIRIFELNWKFNVIIRNNSDLIAFYPAIEFNPQGPKFTQLDKLNNLQPIKPAESLILKAEYRKFEESTGKNRTQIGRMPPPEFGNLGILLGYENSKKRRFYTLFNYSTVDNKNVFLRGKPKDYRNN